LAPGKRGDRKAAKAVETVRSSHPDIGFTVLKEAVNVIAREAIGLRKHISPSLVYMHQSPVLGSDPQAAIAIAEQR
jgi:hypothetical protein